MIPKKHKTRPIRFIELWEAQDWQVKIYGISQHKETGNSAD